MTPLLGLGWLDLALALCSGGLVACSFVLAWQGLTDPAVRWRRW